MAVKSATLDSSGRRCVSLVARAAAVTCALVFAVGAAGVAKDANAAERGEPMVRFSSGAVAVDSSRDLRFFPGALKPGVTYLIRMDGPLSAERVSALAESGVQVRQYFGDEVFLATVEPDAAARLLPVELQFVGKIPDAAKLAEAIGVRPYETVERQTLKAAGKSRVVMWVADTADLNPLNGKLDALGTRVGAAVAFKDWVRVTLELPTADVARLGAIDEVFHVEDAPEFTPQNQTVAWVVQSNVTNRVPLWDHGLHGEGEMGGIIDTRVRQTHCAFSDVVPIGSGHRKIQSYYGPAAAETHGTHTCGTFVGDFAGGGGSPCANGMAYRARVAFRWLNHLNDGTVSLYDALQTNHNDGATIHSNSYNDGSLTAYNVSCVDIDEFMRDNEDDLVVFSVLNGAIPSTTRVKNPENSKNILAVGASRDTPNQHEHASGTLGPTADGRRRPEVFAPGQLIVSASSSTACSTNQQTGTSMATPAVAGMAVLTRQYFLNGFYPSGVETMSDGFTPSGALIKAVIVNSAVDMSGVPDYPSDREGWGRVQLENTLYFEGGARRLWQVDRRNGVGLQSGQNDEYVIFNAGTTEPLKITLAYTDVAGAVNALNPVVNNLNLIVTDPNGVLYRGNVFDVAAGVSIAGGSPDPINNLEQVHIVNPVKGAYTLRVVAVAVNGPIGDPRQGFALVASGEIVGEVGALSIRENGARPEFVSPGETTDVAVMISAATQDVVPGSATLRYRVVPSGGMAGAFSGTPIAMLGGDNYVGVLPGAACGDRIDYYVQAQGDGGATVTLPIAAPAVYYSVEVRERQIALADDFESDYGWSVTFNALTGAFERGVPQLTEECSYTAQPGADHTPGACSLAYVTGMAAGVSADSNDVDLGQSRLISPVLNLAGHDAARLQLAVWFYEGYVPDDVVTIQVSSNGGANWVDAAIVKHGRSAWQEVSLRIDDFVPLTANNRIRIIAEDAGADSLVEVVIDDVLVTAWGCGAPAFCLKGDVNGDGLADGDDIQPFIELLDTACLGSLTQQQHCAADTNEDGLIDSSDVAAFAATLIGG